MEAFSEQLARCLRGRVCVVGVGNVECGDDGFGVLLAERCRARTRASWETPRVGLSPILSRSADFSPQEPASARERSCGLKPALLKGASPLSSSAKPRGLPTDRPVRAPGLKPVGRVPRPSGNETPAFLDQVEKAGQGITIIEAGLNPERHLTRLMDEAFDHVLFVDAVDFGGSPGEVVLLDAAAMVSRWPQVSTHKLSLGLMARLIESAGRAHVHLLGVQPRCLNPGAPLSTELRAALDLLAALLQQAFQEEEEAALPDAHAGACRGSSGGLVPC